MARSSAPNFSWPEDEDGNPMALVSQQVSELINLGNYSNVTVGPSSIHRFVKDTEEDRREGLRECSKDVEKILSEEREFVLESIRQQA
jgi:hypothetical protein